MNANIVPLTEEETRDFLRSLSEPAEPTTTRERRRAIEKKMIKESK